MLLAAVPIRTSSAIDTTVVNASKRSAGLSVDSVPTRVALGSVAHCDCWTRHQTESRIMSLDSGPKSSLGDQTSRLHHTPRDSVPEAFPPTFGFTTDVRPSGLADVEWTWGRAGCAATDVDNGSELPLTSGRVLTNR
jgi:hypothetical protein